MSDWRWPNFLPVEMHCQHCGEQGIDPAFMDALQALRSSYGKPIVVSSAYRCPEHPIEAAKPEPGAHSTGQAADLLVSREDAHRVLKLAFQIGFGGIGVNQRGDVRFIHLDTIKSEPMRPRPTVWSY